MNDHIVTMPSAVNKQSNKSDCDNFAQLSWFIFGGGLIMLVLWYLFAFIATMLLIPFVNSIHIYRISRLLISPTTTYSDTTPVNVGCYFQLSRFFWIFPFGLVLFIIHLVLGLIYLPLTCFKCKWSFYHFRMMLDVLNPAHKVIIDIEQTPFNFHSKSYQIVQNVNDLQDKVVIITGCNAGIGKETAKILYLKECIVIMACRNPEKANIARNDILKEIGIDNEQNLIFMRLDLGDLKTIDEFVMNYQHNKIVNGKLDFLINNAGVMVCIQF